jgi:HTH-type transcriptional repressor of NAD biosynthesis genes
VRYRWVYEASAHLGNVSILLLHDDAPTKGEYTRPAWEADREIVLAFAGQPIDAVFCGDDYGPDSFWAKCYPEAELVILPRDGITSTAIRADPIGHWDWLPAPVRPAYAKKVLIIGVESSGKSTLTANLAARFATTYVEEVGRDLSQRSGTDRLMLADDFTEILLRHKIAEIDALRHANRVLFEDTDALITAFYLDFLTPGDTANAALAAAITGLNAYDLVLCCEPDVPFVQDGDRHETIAADRRRYADEIRERYTAHGYRPVSLTGDYHTRTTRAIALVEALLTEDSND